MTLSQAAQEQPIEYARFLALIDNYQPKNEYVMELKSNYLCILIAIRSLSALAKLVD
jgi:hypothetical protein